MENDPSKKEAKGKRIFKKAVRRNSKSSNSGQNSVLEQSISVTRSKSFENKHKGIEINDGGSLPSESAKDTDHVEQKTILENKTADPKYDPSVDVNNIQTIDHINSEATSTFENDYKFPSPELHITDQSPVEGSKKNLKRKFEEESAAGTSGASTGTSDTDADDKDPSKDKKKKNRCAVCRKKVGLTGFECRCGGLFCAVHRYSDKHECSFDYRELGAQEIRRNNPVVVSQKIHKI